MYDAEPMSLVESHKKAGGVAIVTLLIACLSVASTAAEPAKPVEADSRQAIRPAAPKTDNDWYLLTAGTCEQQDPAGLLAIGQLLGQSMTSHDVRQQGKVVATTISAADGSSAKFYRGKARCEAALTRESGDLDRYK